MPNKDKTITTRDVVEKIDKADQNGTTVLDEEVVTGENKSGVKPITAQTVTEDKSGIIPRMQRLGHINKPLEPMNLDTSKAVDKDAKGALASAVAGNSPVMHTINKTYGNTLEELGKNVGSLVEQGQKARENDKVAQRRERNMQMISGISDGLASLANLIGVGGYGASNIDLSGAMTNPKLQEKFELARKERKADIKDIDDRLEQKRRELLEMQMKFGLAKAEQLQREQTAADAKAEAALGRSHSEKLAKMQIDAAEKGRQEGFAHDAKMQGERIKSQEAISKNEIQARKEIAKMNAEADVSKYAIRYGSSNSKDKTQFVMDDPVSGKMRVIDIGDKSLNNILATYLPIAVKQGEISEDEANDAKNWRSNEVSKTNLLGMVNKSKTMRMALLSAVGEEPEESTPAATQEEHYEPNAPQGASWQDAYPDPSKK